MRPGDSAAFAKKGSAGARRETRGGPPAPPCRRDFPRPYRPFRARPGSGGASADACGVRAHVGFGPGQRRSGRRRAASHRHRQRDRHVLARLYRVLVQDRRHAARPRVRRRNRAPSGRAPRGLRGGRCRQRASTAGRGGFSGAAAGRHAPPRRHRRRRRNRGLQRCQSRARRDAGRPHPDPHPPDRAHGLAAALALASQRRARLVACGDRGRRRGGGGAALRALHRPRRPAASPTARPSSSIAAASISSAPTPSRRCCPRSRSHRCRSSAPTGSG